MNLIAKTALAAAELLIEARKSGPINDLPDNCRPTNIGDVYAIHDAVAAKLGPVLGWKVGAKNATAEPVCAPLLAGTIYQSPVQLDPQKFTMRGMESEIAFRFASDLPMRDEPYSTDQVIDAIDMAFPAIEINETRYVDSDALDPMTKLADNILNGALILGPPWSKWHDLVVADQLVEMRFDNKLLYSHKGGNNAVDILRLVVWIANHKRKKGPGIAAGQVVTTGSWTGLHKAGTAKQVVTSFPGIGDVTVNF
jgi:2-keto-4-pentenoate hydratase